jgi:CotH protein
MVQSVEGWFSGGRGRIRGSAVALSALMLAAADCSTSNTYYIENVIESDPDAGAPAAVPGDEGGGQGAGGDGSMGAGVDEQGPSIEPGTTPLDGVTGDGLTGEGAEADAGVAGLSAGAPEADVAASELPLDVFGTLGNRYWFEVSDAQVEAMNAPYLGGGGGIFYGDFYTPGGAGTATFADHLLVTQAGDAPHTADFGKVQVSLVGQSTGRPWTETTIPNLKLDADEFIDGNRIGEVKHLRLNNAVVGSIYREKLAFDLYRALGYPAPRTNYAWVSGSVWGADVDVPYVVVEAYKPQFCKLREAELGGGCVNMWEFYGDIGSGMLGLQENCQFSECEPTRGIEFEDVIASTPQGEGFKEALSEWLDWDAFHRFQCLSWILETGDDALHNLNNVLLVERADGKFQLLPYSVDISLGQEWYPNGPLAGISTLASGCQSDSACWADTIATCEVLLDEFAAVDPVAMLDAVHTQLESAGMLRSGDDGRYGSMRRHLEERILALPDELELNRDGPVYADCYYPLVLCGDYCAFPEECFICEPPPEEEPVTPAPPEEGADAGAASEPDGDDDDGDEPPPPDDGGQVCLQPIEVYAL